MQFYKIIDYPWPNQTLPNEISQNGAGMDLFIGEPEMIGRGIGQAIISTFLHTIMWPTFKYCVVDPDLRNQSAIKCYQKLGFTCHQIIESTDALYQPVQLQLMVLRNNL